MKGFLMVPHCTVDLKLTQSSSERLHLARDGSRCRDPQSDLGESYRRGEGRRTGGASRVKDSAHRIN